MFALIMGMRREVCSQGRAGRRHARFIAEVAARLAGAHCLGSLPAGPLYGKCNTAYCGGLPASRAATSAMRRRSQTISGALCERLCQS